MDGEDDQPKAAFTMLTLRLRLFSVAQLVAECLLSVFVWLLLPYYFISSVMGIFACGMTTFNCFGNSRTIFMLAGVFNTISFLSGAFFATWEAIRLIETDIKAQTQESKLGSSTTSSTVQNLQGTWEFFAADELAITFAWISFQIVLAVLRLIVTTFIFRVWQRMPDNGFVHVSFHPSYPTPEQIFTEDDFMQGPPRQRSAQAWGNDDDADDDGV